MQIWLLGLIYLAAINIAAYFLMWLDKKRAIAQQWRIPEKTFFSLSLFGGFIGMGLAMRHFRHKTQKWQFKAVFLISVIIWLSLVGYLLKIG